MVMQLERQSRKYNLQILQQCKEKLTYIYDKSSKVKGFDHHFLSSGLLFNNSVDLSVNNNNIQQMAPEQQLALSVNFLFSTEAQNALCKLKSFKITGADNLDSYILPLIAAIICPHFAHIYNLTFLNRHHTTVMEKCFSYTSAQKWSWHIRPK